VGEKPLALVEGGQLKRWGVGLEVTHRVGVEGGDDDRPALVEAERDCAVDDYLDMMQDVRIIDALQFLK
jgi:hypothetical protein